jgi:hypothetical protein
MGTTEELEVDTDVFVMVSLVVLPDRHGRQRRAFERDLPAHQLRSILRRLLDLRQTGRRLPGIAPIAQVIALLLPPSCLRAAPRNALTLSVALRLRGAARDTSSQRRHPQSDWLVVPSDGT